MSLIRYQEARRQRRTRSEIQLRKLAEKLVENQLKARAVKAAQQVIANSESVAAETIEVSDSEEADEAAAPRPGTQHFPLQISSSGSLAGRSVSDASAKDRDLFELPPERDTLLSHMMREMAEAGRESAAMFSETDGEDAVTTGEDESGTDASELYTAQDLAYFDMDMGVFAALPAEIQDEIREKIREQRQAASVYRRQYMLDAAPTPERFSELQMSALVANAKLTAQLRGMSVEQTTGIETRRIASQPGKEYIYMPHEVAEKDAVASPRAQRSGSVTSEELPPVKYLPLPVRRQVKSVTIVEDTEQTEGATEIPRKRRALVVESSEDEDDDDDVPLALLAPSARRTRGPVADAGVRTATLEEHQATAMDISDRELTPPLPAPRPAARFEPMSDSEREVTPPLPAVRSLASVLSKTQLASVDTNASTAMEVDEITPSFSTAKIDTRATAVSMHFASVLSPASKATSAFELPPLLNIAEAVGSGVGGLVAGTTASLGGVERETEEDNGAGVGGHTVTAPITVPTLRASEEPPLIRLNRSPSPLHVLSAVPPTPSVVPESDVQALLRPGALQAAVQELPLRESIVIPGAERGGSPIVIDEAGAADDSAVAVVAQLEAEATRDELVGLAAMTADELQELQSDLSSHQRELQAEMRREERYAQTVTSEMVGDSQELMRLFGVPYITAAAEAEAQCAALERLGLVDGIVTDDSDTFLFGGQVVFKNLFNPNQFVECFKSKDAQLELGLTRERFIQLALLLGSDYTVGLPGVGAVTSMEILDEFRDLKEFRKWFEEHVRYKITDETDETTVRRIKKFKGLFKKVEFPGAFPDLHVVQAYNEPMVDDSDEGFSWQRPDLDGLRKFVEERFSWSRNKADSFLLPLVRRLEMRETLQPRIDSIFSRVQLPPSEAFGSVRLQRAVLGLTGRAATSETGTAPIVKPKARKAVAGSRLKRSIMEVGSVSEVIQQTPKRVQRKPRGKKAAVAPSEGDGLDVEI